MAGTEMDRGTSMVVGGCRIRAMFGLLVTVLAVAPACNSTGAAADANGGAGGEAAVDAGPTEISFACGDASCVTGETYCRQVSAPGGQSGSNGPSEIVSYGCAPLNADCAPRNCTCVTVHQGFYDCASADCSQLDSGAVLASCSKV